MFRDPGDRVGHPQQLRDFFYAPCSGIRLDQSFGHGGFYALISPTVAEFFGTKFHGVLLGMVIFSTTIGGALGPFLAGYLFDVTNTYRVVFLTLAGTSLAALMLTATLTPTAHQRGIAQIEQG